MHVRSGRTGHCCDGGVLSKISPVNSITENLYICNRRNIFLTNTHLKIIKSTTFNIVPIRLMPYQPTLHAYGHLLRCVVSLN